MQDPLDDIVVGGGAQLSKLDKAFVAFDDCIRRAVLLLIKMVDHFILWTISAPPFLSYPTPLAV